jgi:serine/threonine-protein kinase
MDPLRISTLLNLANTYAAVGRLDDAEDVCREAIDLRPEFESIHLSLGAVHLLRGHAEKARASLTRFSELAGLGGHGRLSADAMVEHTAGNGQASKRAAEEFEERFGAGDPMVSAEIRAWRGEPDAAFAWLDKAVAARDPLLTTIRYNPMLRSLHPDPRWNMILEKIGLPAD